MDPTIQRYAYYTLFKEPSMQPYYGSYDHELICELEVFPWKMKLGQSPLHILATIYTWDSKPKGAWPSGPQSKYTIRTRKDKEYMTTVLSTERIGFHSFSVTGVRRTEEWLCVAPDEMLLAELNSPEDYEEHLCHAFHILELILTPLWRKRAIVSTF
jgi:hypothetical protein